jgi:hypothetical protein
LNHSDVYFLLVKGRATIRIELYSIGYPKNR